MAWTTPLTAVSSTALTAAQWNSSVRDNFLTTAPAKSLTEFAGYFVSTAANVLVERVCRHSRNFSTTVHTTTSTSYTDLESYGPSVTLTTGTKAIVWFAAEMDNSTADAYVATSVAVSGATTTAASDEWGLEMDGFTDLNRRAQATMMTLTAGVNTFTLKYRQSGGTGSFVRREIIVFPL